MSSRFSRNSEWNALKFLENVEEMLTQYYMHSGVCILTHTIVLPVVKWLINLQYI